jgi:metal-sulfur cluster biosynthetic enzyme
VIELGDISGSGPAELRRSVVAEIEAIADPCSIAAGHPTGLAGMGMVERVDVTGGSVAVLILPTFPTCMFRGVFETEIEQRLRALPWCESVTVAFCPADQAWDESRMSAAVRAKFGRRARGRVPRQAPAGVVDR